MICKAGWVENSLAEKLKKMVGFRNIAVHDYNVLEISITIAIIKDHLDDFLDYARSLLMREGC